MVTYFIPITISKSVSKNSCIYLYIFCSAGVDKTTNQTVMAGFSDHPSSKEHDEYEYYVRFFSLKWEITKLFVPRFKKTLVLVKPRF